MMENIEVRINSLKKRLEDKKNEKNRAEANLEVQEKQLTEVTAQIQALGYEPEQFPEVIAQLEASILEGLNQVEQILKDAEPISTEEMLRRVNAQ